MLLVHGQMFELSVSFSEERLLVGHLGHYPVRRSRVGTVDFAIKIGLKERKIPYCISKY